MLHQNLGLLKTFQVVTSRDSVKEAAVILSVTPSAVSQNLKKLEAELGFQLFLRQHKKIILSPKGQQFQREVLPLLEGLEEKISSFMEREKEVEPMGDLYIGAPFEIGATLLVRRFAEFKLIYPKVKVRFSFAPPVKLLEMLERGEVDFCLAANGPHFKQLPPSIARQKMFQEEFALMIPKKLKGSKRSFTFEELEKLPHLDYEFDGGVVKNWYQFHYSTKPKKLDIVMASENALSLFEGVKSNLGVAVLPVERILSAGGEDSYFIFRPSEKKMQNSVLLLQHLSKKPSLAEKRFIEFLKSDA